MANWRNGHWQSDIDLSITQDNQRKKFAQLKAYWEAQNHVRKK